MLTGNNGILRQATKAKENTEKSQAIEETRIEILGKLAENKGNGVSEIQIKESINKYFNDVPEDLTDQTQEVTTKPNKYKVKLSEILGGIYIKSIENPEMPIVDATAYGKKVTNYREGEDWEILYQGAVEDGGESRIYLIKTETVDYSNWILKDDNNVEYGGSKEFANSNILNKKYPAVKQGLLYKTYKTIGTESGLKYSSDNKNMKATQGLLDSSLSKWKAYEDTHTEKFADYVIGTPTLELFVASYNAVNPNQSQIITNPVGNGYKYDDFFHTQGCLPSNNNTPWNHWGGMLWYDYWLACPSSEYNDRLRIVDAHLSFINSWYESSNRKVRPVVCLNANLYLKEHNVDGVTTYTIEK